MRARFHQHNARRSDRRSRQRFRARDARVLRSAKRFRFGGSSVDGLNPFFLNDLRRRIRAFQHHAAFAGNRADNLSRGAKTRAVQEQTVRRFAQNAPVDGIEVRDGVLFVKVFNRPVFARIHRALRVAAGNDVFAELGARRVRSVGVERTRSRTIDVRVRRGDRRIHLQRKDLTADSIRRSRNGGRRGGRGNNGVRSDARRFDVFRFQLDDRLNFRRGGSGVFIVRNVFRFNVFRLVVLHLTANDPTGGSVDARPLIRRLRINALRRLRGGNGGRLRFNRLRSRRLRRSRRVSRRRGRLRRDGRRRNVRRLRNLRNENGRRRLRLRINERLRRGRRRRRIRVGAL